MSFAPSRYRIVLAASFLTASCMHHPVIERSGKPLAELSPRFIGDARPLRNEPHPSLEDLALTLPVFEGNPARVSERRGARYEPGGRTWILAADGGQVPVKVDRLTPEKVGPTRIRVTLGPKAMHAPGEVWIYELERRPGGWRKISAKTKRMELLPASG